MNQTIQLLESHCSIRKFTPQAIPQDTINTLINAGQSAATSSFIQACTVIQVQDKSNRSTLAGLAGNQKYIESCATFLVFCADMRRHKLACEMHQQQMQSGFTEQFLTASLDCALFAQNVVIAAESLKLGAVYIGGLRNKIELVGELLNLPELVFPVFGLCLGYPDQNPAKKPRLPLPVILKQERYDDRDDEALIAQYDVQIKDYYASRGTNVKQQGWSDQISNMLNKEARPHMLDYLQRKGFIKK
ncbi:MAG: putative NADPH-flavin oxidoreductase [Osedax symbiont Rs1]|nr:MAG: putative NADPH-flavin oxidoreductase [Osedax symbiont Rs1]